jgi:signal transduction histidine kinase
VTEQPDIAVDARDTTASAEDLLRQEIGALRSIVAHQDMQIACIQEIAAAQGSTISLDKLLNMIMDRVTVLMRADRSTLFVVDEDRRSLWSRVIQGDQIHEIRLDVGQGIAGWVAQTGKSVNIRDAYQDPRFDPEVDMKTGYRTRSILCQPVRNRNREIIGVAQVLNRQDGHFSIEDENLLSALAAQIAVGIENQKLYLKLVSKNLELTEFKEKLERRVGELDLLYELQREISRAVDVRSLIEAAGRTILDTVKAEICVVTLREGRHHRAYSIPSDTTTPMSVVDRPHLTGTTELVFDAGIACIQDSDSGEDVEHAVTQQLGVRVHSVVAVPLLSDDECIGTLELVNKRGVAQVDQASLEDDESITLRAPGFTDGEMKLLTLMAAQLSGVVAASLHREEREKEERLATIGQMLSGVIHDFKTPVTIISGYVQLMATQDDPAVRRDYAQNVITQFDQLNKMTKEILAFARGETNILFRRVFLKLLTNELDEVLRRDLGERGIDLVIETEYGGAAQMDDVKIKRALFNLARNAAEAMPDGGTFTIDISADDENLILRVGDDGPGIPEEIRSSLFDSFVTSGKEGGTGLGLAIVKKIVDQHHGTIEVETAKDEGTTFILTLPLAQD